METIGAILESELFLKLLDWPFLMFVLIVGFLVLFRNQVVELLNRGDITISWGTDRHISLKDIGKNLGQELDALNERMEALEERVRAAEGTADTEAAATVAAPEPDLEAVKERALKALKDPRYEWRTLDRLATISGSTGDEVRQVLRAQPDVEFGSTRGGDPLVKLNRMGG